MARASALHRHTPALAARDARGLPLREVAYCRAEPGQAAARRITLTRHDVAGQVRQQWDPRAFETQQHNDAAPPNQRTLTSLSGRTLLGESSDAGWQLTLPGDAGQPVESRDGRGSRWRTRFDERLRPIQVRESTGGQPERVSTGFTYANEAGSNCRGRLVRQDDDAGSRRVSGYSLGGLKRGEIRRFLATLDLPDWPDATAERDALLEPGTGAFTRFSYNPAGQLLEQADALGNRQFFRFNLAGERIGARLALQEGAQHALLVEARYNALGQVERQTAGNGVVSHCEYDAATGRLSRLTASRPGRSTLQDLCYDYDPVGNVLKIEDRSQPVSHFANQRVEPVSTFFYDSLYQLIEAIGREALGSLIGPQLPELAPNPGDTSHLLNYRQHYAYDASGNLLELRHLGQQAYTRTMNVAQHSNRAVPVPADPLDAFDPNGNLHTLDGGQPLQWNARNQLHGTRQVAREGGTDDEEHYRYGGDGLRVRKVATRLVSGRMQSHEIRYLPGLELHTRTGESFAVVTAQIAHSSVRCLHWQQGQPDDLSHPQLRYSLDDPLGSSHFELDGDARIISHEGYYPFGGSAWWAARSAVEAGYKTHRYSGKARDDSGLYDYGLRYYAPWLMRWINPDPAGDADGLNRYRFVRNNPVTLRDPWGLTGVPAEPSTLEKRRRYIADPQRFSHARGVYPHGANTVESKHLVDGEETNDTFLIKIKPDKWTIIDMEKPSGSRAFYTSDVIWHVVHEVSVELGFANEGPLRIKQQNVTNRETFDQMIKLKNGSEEMKTIFLNSTPNGKVIKNVLKDFGMTASNVSMSETRTLGNWDVQHEVADIFIDIEQRPGGPAEPLESPAPLHGSDESHDYMNVITWDELLLQHGVPDERPRGTHQ